MTASTADILCSDRVVCRCLQVTEVELVEALTTREVQDLKDVRRHTGAGSGCMACHRLIRRYLERHCYSASAVPSCSER